MEGNAAATMDVYKPDTLHLCRGSALHHADRIRSSVPAAHQHPHKDANASGGDAQRNVVGFSKDAQQSCPEAGSIKRVHIA